MPGKASLIRKVVRGLLRNGSDIEGQDLLKANQQMKEDSLVKRILALPGPEPDLSAPSWGPASLPKRRSYPSPRPQVQQIHTTPGIGQIDIDAMNAQRALVARDLRNVPSPSEDTEYFKAFLGRDPRERFPEWTTARLRFGDSYQRAESIVGNPKWPEMKRFIDENRDPNFTPEFLGSGADAVGIRVARDKVIRIGGAGPQKANRHLAGRLDVYAQGRLGTKINPAGGTYRTGTPDLPGMNAPSARLQFPDETINAAVTKYYPNLQLLRTNPEKALSHYNLNEKQMKEVKEWVKGLETKTIKTELRTALVPVKRSQRAQISHLRKHPRDLHDMTMKPQIREGQKVYKEVKHHSDIISTETHALLRDLSKKNLDIHHDALSTDNLGFKMFDDAGDLLPRDQRKVVVIDIGSIMPTPKTPSSVIIKGVAPGTLIGGSKSNRKEH